MSIIDELDVTLGSLEVPLQFHRRPDPIPADLRLGWRLGNLVLLLHKCRSDTASMQQLHVLTWAMRTQHNRTIFIRWMSGDKRPDDIIVRYDPSLARTVDLAIGIGLIRRNDNGSISLEQMGNELAVSIEKRNGLLALEKAFLQQLPRKISQKFVNELIAWR